MKIVQRITGDPRMTRFVTDKSLLPARREGQSLRARRSRQWGWLKEWVRKVRVVNIDINDLATPMK